MITTRVYINNIFIHDDRVLIFLFTHDNYMCIYMCYLILQSLIRIPRITNLRVEHLMVPFVL
jgi:hypothetical protein